MSNHRQTLMISTCGTSLLTNKAERQVIDLLRTSANLRQQDLTPEQQKVIDERVQACREQLNQSDTATVRQLSAELNGLLGFYENQLKSRGRDQLFLLHTDTYQGDQVANILEGYLRSHGLNVSKQTFTDLRTDTVENFQRGITEVIRWCEDVLLGYRQRQFRVVFNLTGGFKSIQGWMQTLGMFYADEIVYIFESGPELLRIPRIPIAIDEASRKEVEGHLRLFRTLEPSRATCHVDDLGNVAEVFFYRLGDQAELSTWGRLVWERCRKPIYANKLHNPPSDHVSYSDKFKNAASGLAQDRLVQVNERIDDLVGFLRDHTNPKRLDFKRLKGNPCPPSTHECDAWADQSAWRIFAHFDGQTLILDDLGEGLH